MQRCQLLKNCLIIGNFEYRSIYYSILRERNSNDYEESKIVITSVYIKFNTLLVALHME